MRIKTIFFLTLTLLLSNQFYSQGKPAYLLYDSNGKLASYENMMKSFENADVVFFGEYHTNPISHWMQIEVLESLHKVKNEKLVIGAEMFENGNQLVIDEYLAGFYDEKKMKPEISNLWGNYDTDYKPILDYAKKNNLRFIATNIPRRYADYINKKGLDALKDLSPEAQAMIGSNLVELFDPNVKAYAEMKDHMGGHVPKNMINIQAAQAAKDATMAQFILKNLNEGDLFYHLNGSYHSNYNQGIAWWINQVEPELVIKLITTVNESEWEKLSKDDKSEIADYIIVVPDNMTKTQR